MTMARPSRAALGVGFVLGVVLLAGVVGLSGAAVAQPNDNATDRTGSFGAQVASFMQSTAVEANASVEQGMWRETVDDGDDPDAAVRTRARRLEARIDALENRADRLDGEGPGAGVAYTARASALRAELASIRESVDDTSRVARRQGVDDDALAEVRRLAGNATGPEVAAAARNLTDAGRGPPDWATDGGPGGPRADPGVGPGNGTDAGPSNGTDGGPGPAGPPGDRGDPDPPDDRGGGGPSAGDGDGVPPDGGGDGGPPENGGRDGPPGGDRDGPPADDGDESDSDANGPAGSGGAPGDGSG